VHRHSIKEQDLIGGDAEMGAQKLIRYFEFAKAREATQKVRVRAQGAINELGAKTSVTTGQTMLVESLRERGRSVGSVKQDTPNHFGGNIASA
jgi:hypothetical protein